MACIGTYGQQSPWSDVKKEMTEEKGLDPVVADKIGEYVKHKGAYPYVHEMGCRLSIVNRWTCPPGAADSRCHAHGQPERQTRPQRYGHPFHLA